MTIDEFLRWAPIVISLFALLVSAGSFAYQHLYVNDHVVCSLTGYKSGRSENGGASATLAISISNAGTRTIMIERVELKLMKPSSPSGGMTYYGAGQKLDPPTLPRYIPKGEFIHFHIEQSVPLHSLRNLAARPPEHAGMLGTYDFYLTLRFMNVAGEKKEIQKKAASVEISATDSIGCTGSFWINAPFAIRYKEIPYLEKRVV